RACLFACPSLLPTRRSSDLSALSLVDGLHAPGAGRPDPPRYRAERAAQSQRALRTAEEPCAGDDLRESLDPHPPVLRSRDDPARDRKSTRLNSSHVKISYAV